MTKATIQEPYFLDEHVKARFLEAIRLGSSIPAAAGYCGVSRSQVYRWLQDGRKDDASPILRQLVADFEKAEAHGEMSLLTLIQLQAKEDWRAAAWVLEHRHPERWGGAKAAAMAAVQVNVNATAGPTPPEGKDFAEYFAKLIDVAKRQGIVDGQGNAPLALPPAPPSQNGNGHP